MPCVVVLPSKRFHTISTDVHYLLCDCHPSDSRRCLESPALWLNTLPQPQIGVLTMILPCTKYEDNMMVSDVYE